MSQFKLGGVPSHAYELFYRLRDAVNEPDGKGEQWSDALKALLDIGDPSKAKSRLESGKIYTGALAGTISSVNQRGNAGVVRLDTPLGKLSLGVISPETEGRIAFMNQQQDGKLKAGTPVVIASWQKGPEALRILKLAPPA